MKKMLIYEPAMCCPTGLCGVGVDPELLRISTALNTLKKKGIIIERYNLSNSPQEFVNNEEISRLMEAGGVEILPATVVDGEVKITKRYPTNEEIITLLDLSPEALVEEQKLDNRVKIKPKTNEGCGCKGGCC